jgi:DNA-3-methyladenine glycosylase II
VTTRAEEPAHPDGDAGFRFLRECGDPVMAGLVERIGPLDHESRRRGRPDDAYGSLVRTIVGQQLSTRAARTIYGRLTALFGDRAPTPAELIAAEEEALREAGLSRQKIRYLRDLAARVHGGELELHVLHELSDEEVSGKITAVKGLGRWSADMFLMFHLRRPDVLPVGDLGIRRAVEKAYGLPGLPDEDDLRTLASPWRPQRTLACLYLWEILD